MLTAKSIKDLPGTDEILSMSGLDFMQAILRGETPPPPMAVLMNYALEDVADGRVVFRGSPAFSHTNPMGGTHGGWYGTLLDSCMACAVMTKVPQGSVYTTLEYKVNLIRGIPLGCDIRATGVVDHSGRSTGVAHGEIRGVDDNRLYATGSTTCLILQMDGR